ncbi:hypothetical protein MMC21_002193 [Puttea exsequens]|nr:hypothetical protein [Puttea exsequens]
MPQYEVQHIVPITGDQKDLLASAITTIHSQLFTTPSFFVNVRFTNTAGLDSYVGGKRKPTNRILATVRPGNRFSADFTKLCKSVAEAWDQIVCDRAGVARGTAGTELGGVTVVAGIVAGVERGLVLPAAGEDRAWLKEHVEEFRRLAEGGDEDFRDLLLEMEHRKDLKGVV